MAASSSNAGHLAVGLGDHDGHALVAADPHGRHERDLGRAAGTPRSSASCLPAARAEELVARAVVAGEPRHVLDDPAHRQLQLAGRVGRALGDPLGRRLRRRDDEELGRGRYWPTESVTSPGPRGHVDEQEVRAPPSGRRRGTARAPCAASGPARSPAVSSSTKKPIDRQRTPWATGGTTRSPMIDGVASTPEHPGHREPVDVGVEDPDVVCPRAARATARFTVTDDLPTPPLPDEIASTRVVDRGHERLGDPPRGRGARPWPCAVAVVGGVHGAAVDRRRPASSMRSRARRLLAPSPVVPRATSSPPRRRATRPATRGHQTRRARRAVGQLDREGHLDGRLSCRSVTDLADHARARRAGGAARGRRRGRPPAAYLRLRRWTWRLSSRGNPASPGTLGDVQPDPVQSRCARRSGGRGRPTRPRVLRGGHRRHLRVRRPDPPRDLPLRPVRPRGDRLRGGRPRSRSTRTWPATTSTGSPPVATSR